MPVKNNSGNGNGQSTQNPETPAIEPDNGLTLHMDKTIGQMLSASDDVYSSFIANVKRDRDNKIKSRVREVADLLNPQKQVEEIMVRAERIVDAETAGASAIGASIPTFRMMGGYD